MEMKKVLKVIVIRSGILLSLLVVLIMAIKTMVQHGPPGTPQKEKTLVVLIGEEIQENDLHIKGIKDGIAYNGLQYILKESSIKRYPDTNDPLPGVVYCPDPCVTEEFLREEKSESSQLIVGYSYINKNQENYIGIYSGLNWKEIFPIYQRILPGMKRLGVIYTQGSCDGEKQALNLKKMLETTPKISIIIYTLDPYTLDITGTISELLPHIDALYAVSRDKIIQEQFETIARICLENKIPLIGGGINGPKKGAVASIVHNPYRVGRKNTELIRAFERGRSASEIGIVKIEPELYLNLTSAYSLSLIIPSDVRKTARQVFN